MRNQEPKRTEIHLFLELQNWLTKKMVRTYCFFLFLWLENLSFRKLPLSLYCYCSGVQIALSRQSLYFFCYPSVHPVYILVPIAVNWRLLSPVTTSNALFRCSVLHSDQGTAEFENQIVKELQSVVCPRKSELNRIDVPKAINRRPSKLRIDHLLIEDEAFEK